MSCFTKAGAVMVINDNNWLELGAKPKVFVLATKPRSSMIKYHEYLVPRDSFQHTYSTNPQSQLSGEYMQSPVISSSTRLATGTQLHACNARGCSDALG